jgi:predicted acyl esterase
MRVTPRAGIRFYYEELFKTRGIYPYARRDKTLHCNILTRDSTFTCPILIVKTPYGIKPYGDKNFPESLGPLANLAKEAYIFAYQDARGMFMSEGNMLQMTPHRDDKKDSTDIDNSSDTFDTVEWLLKHTNNNGRVGLWGIS